MADNFSARDFTLSNPGIPRKYHDSCTPVRYLSYPRRLLTQLAKLAGCGSATLRKKSSSYSSCTQSILCNLSIGDLYLSSSVLRFLPCNPCNGFWINLRHSFRSIVFSELSINYPHSSRYPREESWRGQFRTCNSTVASREFTKKNKHLGADIHDPKARTSTTLRDFQKLRSEKLWAEFSFPKFSTNFDCEFGSDSRGPENGDFGKPCFCPARKRGF